MIQKHTAAGEKSQGQTDLISPRKILILVTTRWYFFLAAIVIALALAYLYARFTVPVFRVSTTILMEEADHSRVQGMESQMLEGFGLNPAATNLENQLYVLTSWSLVGETLRDLPFETDVYTRGLSRKVSFYPMYPLRLVAETPGRVPYDIEFEFEYLEDNLVHLSTGPKAILQMDTIASFGQPVYTPRGTFRIFPHPDMEHLYKSSTKIYLKFNSHDALTEGYRNRLKVGPVSDESTIVQLSLEGTNRWKDQLFLDKLLEVFLARNLAKKNHEASRIIDFIDAQLGQVSDSLKITENQLQEFRSRNRIMDVSSQAQQIIDQSVVFENERARLTLESNYYQYLKEYLSKDNNQEVPISPATMGIEDPILARLMQELGGLQAEYFGTEMKEKNPLQAQLELRIRNTKESIRETLQGIMLANQMAVAENEQQIEALNARASILPEKERQLLGIERKFNLNNVLYTFLLQERAEAQIQKASN
ncbi:MAG: hypothetical protein EHM46_00850, partial [Bacteroidetes bacterium]